MRLVVFAVCFGRWNRGDETERNRKRQQYTPCGRVRWGKRESGRAREEERERERESERDKRRPSKSKTRSFISVYDITLL